MQRTLQEQQLQLMNEMEEMEEMEMMMLMNFLHHRYLHYFFFLVFCPGQNKQGMLHSLSKDFNGIDTVRSTLNVVPSSAE